LSADGSPERAVQIFIYSADPVEPPHVHVQRDNGSAKFWLEPVRLERSKGFSASEIRRIEDVVEEPGAVADGMA
jgi:hypothetical protein